jgi:hypothetical protein
VTGAAGRRVGGSGGKPTGGISRVRKGGSITATVNGPTGNADAGPA